VFGDAAVKGSEKLKNEEKAIEYHCIGNNPSQHSHLILAGIKFADLSYEKTEQEQESRSCCKGRCQKTCRHNRSQPEMPSRDACVQKCCDRVNTECPGDRNIGQEFDPFLIRHPFSLCRQYIPPHNNIQEEITVQNDHIPEQNRFGTGIHDHVQHPDRVTNVHENKQQTHDYCGNGQEFSQNGNFSKCFVIMNIIWEYHHNPSGGNTHKIGELGDIQAPGNIPAHAGYLQTLAELE